MTAKNTAFALELLAEAAQWRLLSLLHLRPTVERREEARRLASEVGLPALADAAQAWCEHATEGAYQQLFGPGGLVPAREVAYRPFTDPGWLLSDLARLHQAFGFRGGADEPADHVAVLADFVAYLLMKEAYARHCGDEDAAAAARRARDRFTQEHLSPVAARLAERLEACGATQWAAAARLIAARIPPPPAAPPPAIEEEVLQCAACSTAIER